MHSKPLILCVDNEQNTLDLLTFSLEASGYAVRALQLGRDALSTATDSPPDLIVMDLNLPDLVGFDLLKSLRTNHATSTVPVILLTDRCAESDIVMGFELGADDYISKPFSVREFTARVRAVLRRSSGSLPDEMIRVGPLTIDSGNYEAFHGEKRLPLTLKEYELLKLLASSPGKVLTRDFLLDRIWGYEFYGETRTVDVHIRHIRMKLGEDADMIETVRGVGYKMRLPA